MKPDIRKYLADIGRRGGTRSRRTLSSEQARAMVERREQRKHAAAFARLAANTLRDVPGFELIERGVQDLAQAHETIESLIVSVGAPRLRLLGIPVPAPLHTPEERLFDLLAREHGAGAHSRYNALVRRLVSFNRSAAIALRAHA